MAIIDVTEYKIGDNTYRYRDASMIEELAEKVNYSDVEATLDDTSEMPIQNQAVANAITALDNDKLNISDIDDAFDNTSTNPLQNKVITDKINDIGDFASNSHAGIVKVGDSLTMDTVDENPGFLNIRYPVYISPSYTGEDDTTIATYTDNLGNSGVIKVPTSVGTEVVPNPVEPATGTLTKIQIDDTVYNIAGSGGGSGPSRVDLLYTNSGTTFDNITLSQAYTNYDIICFTVMTDLAENDEKTSTFFGKDQLQVNDYIRLHGSTTTSNWLKYQIESTTGFSKVAAATSEYVSTVYGIKLGGGSQVSVTPEYSTGTLLATVSIDNVDTEIYAAPEYELPIAGASTLGGIKVGSGLSIDSSTGVLSATGGGGATALDDLTDVSIDDQTLTSGQVLKYNGTNWVNAADGGGTVTDVEVDGTSVVSSGVAAINTMTGAGASAAGSKGLVPAPASGDNEKFLRGDGTWQPISGGTTVVANPTSGTAVAPLSNLQVGNDIYSIPSASGGALYGTTNPSDAIGSNGSLYFKYNARKIITTYGKTNNHWTYVAGMKPPEVINFDNPVYFGKQSDYTDGSYTYTATASKRLIAINLCLGVLASGVIDINTSITTTGTVVDTLTNSTSGGTDDNREIQQIYKIIEVSSGDTITFSNIITTADYSEQTYIIAEIESFITGFTFVDAEVREDNALDNKYNYPLSNDGYYLTYAYSSQRNGTDMTATITSYKNIVDEYTSDSTNGYQIDMAVSDIVDSGTIKCTTKPEYSWSTQVYSIVKLNMATVPELVLFDNGAGGTNWTIIDNRGEIRSDCISLQTGAGTFVSQAQYNDQIDLTNYINLHVICRYRGANYNTTFDISSYSGLYTLSFRYITDMQHNEAAVGLTWYTGSGTETDTLRIASNNNSPAEELLYYFSLS